MPTVVMWVDGNVYNECGEEMEASGALLICDQSVWQRDGQIGLKTRVGDAAHEHEALPTELCCNGNTGVCAARWALALGCAPVFLLGMDAAYQGQFTNFYGRNKWHRTEPGPTSTLTTIRRELKWLLGAYPGRVLMVRNGEHLRNITSTLPNHPQEDLRAWVREQLGVS